MNTHFITNYNLIRPAGTGFFEQERGLIAVWGKEAVQFLDGLISNDVKKLADGSQMRAAFPNAKGRLLAVVRVLRHGEKFLFETEESTREKVFKNLFRFTYAGDFFVEDLSNKYRYFELFGTIESEPGSRLSSVQKADGGQADVVTATGFDTVPDSSILFASAVSSDHFVPVADADALREGLPEKGFAVITDELYEVLRIEHGVPRYGIDMDETTIVPELGINGLVSYNKGCYVGQEIIARIHFRGHIAKQLTGLVLSSSPYEPGVPDGRDGLISEFVNAELRTPDGKNAGRITSVTFSPKLDKTIALAFVRYDYLAEGTELRVDKAIVKVKSLPFYDLV